MNAKSALRIGIAKARILQRVNSQVGVTCISE
jgi:hypothetical protein